MTNMKLSAYLPTGTHPFTGVVEIKTPVRVRLKFLPERYFSKESMLGESRKEYLEEMKGEGIQLYKTYEVIRVEGYGDVADITIKENDYGVEKTFMSWLFRDEDEYES